MFIKLTLRTKLLLLVVPPFLALGIFTFDKIQHERKRISEMEVVRAKMDQLEAVSSLTHEFQKERDFAVKFLVNPLLSAEKQLKKQLSLTDSVEAFYRVYLIQSLNDTTDFKTLNEFQSVRNALTGYSLGPDQVEEAYNNIINHYLDLVAAVGAEINTPLTKEEMKAYLALAQSKERLGRIRNMVNKALVFNMFQRLEYGVFSGEKGAFEYNMSLFMKHSPANLKTRFNMDLQGGTMLNTLQILDYCFENQTNALTDFTAEDWWISATGTINLLHELEIFVLSSIRGSLQTQEKALSDDIDGLFLMLASVLFGMLVLVALITKSITNPLKKIEKAAAKINLGDTNVNVAINTNDEIGNLAYTFNKLASTNNQMAKVANAIGEGDYDMELQLRSSEDVLGQALLKMRDNLKAKTQTLRQNIDELKQSYQYKSDFLANMSHELRTPLNSMLILASLLKEDKSKNLEPEQLEFIDIIHTSGANLLELINDILDLSKIEAGKLTVEITEVNFFKIIDDAHRLFFPVSQENKLNFSIIQTTDLPEFIASDGMRLSQILRNLISNSMKFTPAGGDVNLSLSVVNERLKMVVSDTGIGIPKAQQEKIFGAFNQADGSTSRKYGGTGLGLSITTNLVGLLGGEITMKSEEEVGTSFTVEVPIKIIGEALKKLPPFKLKKRVAEKATVQTEFKQSASESLKHEVQKSTSDFEYKVLLIDDDISNVFTLSGALPNFEIDEAGTLDELLEKQLSLFDAVIFNKNTKGFDLKTLDEQFKNQEIVFIKVGAGEVCSDLSDVGTLRTLLLDALA